MIKTKIKTGLALLSLASVSWSAGMATHLNMSKDAIADHVQNAELKQILSEYDRFMLTGTVYPDFGGSVGVLPWREARGTFGQTHRASFHEPYFNYLKDTYEVDTCLERNDQQCLKAVSNYMGIIAHSIQDTAWDILFVRKAFIKDYQTDDLWVGDLDTGGDVLMWDIGRGIGFSYSAPYSDLINVYSRLGQTVSENYIGDGLRTHNLALEFENEFFSVNNESEKYHHHAPWFMANAMTDPIGIPLYSKLTAKIWDQMWTALTSEQGLDAISPVMFEWPAANAEQAADAYSVTVLNRAINSASVNNNSVYMTNENGDVITIGRRIEEYSIATLPIEDMQLGQQYTVHITADVTFRDGSRVFPQGYQKSFTAGESDGFWKTGLLFENRNPGGVPRERDHGPGYFSLVDQGAGLCVDVKDAVVFNGANIQANNCNGSDSQQWYVRASGNDGHTRGTQLVSKLDNTYCIDLAAGNTSNGNNIQLWRCEVLNHNMSWAVQGDGFIAAKNNPQAVMDIAGTAAGANVTIFAKHGNGNQRFNRVPLQDYKAERIAIKSAENGQCLTPEDDSGIASVQLENCDNSAKQQWWLEQSGRIRNGANYLACLHVENANDNQVIETRACDSAVENKQRWDIHHKTIASRLNTRLVLKSTADSPRLALNSGTANTQWLLQKANGDVVNSEAENRICFYENNGHSGRELCLPEGDYATLGNGWDNVISGVKFHQAGNLYVEAYEHQDFSGTRYKMMVDGNFGAFKDRFSSLRIKARPHINFACFYEDPDFRSTPLCDFVGGQDGDLNNEHMNDKAQSVRLFGDSELHLYQHKNFSGGKEVVKQSTEILPSRIDNQTTSYQVKAAGNEPDRVCFYENNAYQGRSVCLNPGQSISNLGALNDRISSIRFSGNAYAQVFEHGNFSGNNFAVMADTQNMGAFKDRITSLKVFGRAANAKFACGYEDHNYRGTATCALQGQGAAHLNNAHLDDKISSVRLFNGARLKLYDHPNFNGGAYQVNNNEIDLGWIENRASSMRVE